MGKDKSGWTDYIKNLPSFPALTQRWERDFVREVRRNLPKAAVETVLEVGCSNGRWLRWFSREYDCEVCGVDLSPIGFSRPDVLNFTIGDALHLPFNDRSFDVVYSLGLVEHFKEKTRYQILGEQYRVLRDSGFLICQVPNLQFSVEYLWVKLIYDYRQGLKHFKTTSRELREYYNRLGLETVFFGFTGLFRDLDLLERPWQLRHLVSTEVLIIGKRVG